MPGQVGRLSDSIDHEEEGGARARMMRAAKPTGHVYRGGPSTLGDGDMCPVDGHGRMIVGSRGQFCPHQEHDKERVRKDG